MTEMTKTNVNFSNFTNIFFLNLFSLTFFSSMRHIAKFMPIYNNIYIYYTLICWRNDFWFIVKKFFQGNVLDSVLQIKICCRRLIQRLCYYCWAWNKKWQLLNKSKLKLIKNIFPSDNSSYFKNWSQLF